MRTTEILMSEHRVIERVLLCLDAMAESAFAKNVVDVPSARDALEFLRTFADGCHHMKEEKRLFPAMERCGLPADAGPTAVMRHEHDLGRARIRAMAMAVDAFEKGQAGAADKFAFETRGFVDLLREHIAKEDQVLFPMADRMLPPSMQDDLLRGFEHAEAHEVAPGAHERCLAIADELCARFGIEESAAQKKAHTCSCSHGH